MRLCRSFFLSLLETCNQVILVPFFFAQNDYCSRDIVLTVELQAYRSVILKVKRELNRSHWSNYTRSFLRSDYRLTKKQRPCELLLILLLSNTSRGARGLRKEEFFFSSLPEQFLIITSSSYVTVCTVKRDMVIECCQRHGRIRQGIRGNGNIRETGNKEMGWGMNETRTLQSLINIQCWTLYLNWTDKKVKTKTIWLLKLFQYFGLLYTFFRLVRRLKHGSSYRG